MVVEPHLLANEVEAAYVAGLLPFQVSKLVAATFWAEVTPEIKAISLSAADADSMGPKVGEDAAATLWNAETDPASKKSAGVIVSIAPIDSASVDGNVPLDNAEVP